MYRFFHDHQNRAVAVFRESRPATSLISTSLKTAFCVLLACAASSIYGQTPFVSSTTLAAGKIPQGVAVVPGSQDIVVANYSSNTFSSFPSKGNGQFGPPSTYATCAGPKAILAADLDHDGIQDVALTCQEANEVEVFIGRASGGYGSPLKVAVARGPVAITTADLNADGRPDIAVASYSGVVTVLLPGTGPSLAYTSRTVSGVGLASGIVAAKFDSKSASFDLAVTDMTHDVVHILRGDGTGNFTFAADIPVGSGPTGIVAGDWDRDTAIDFAVVNSHTNTVSVEMGAGDGVNFTPAASLTIGTSKAPTYAPSIIATDINRDGNLDLITAAPGQNRISTFLGMGTGDFQSAQVSTSAHYPTYLAVGDFVPNGLPDVVVAEQSGQSVDVLINTANVVPILPPPTPMTRGHHIQTVFVIMMENHNWVGNGYTLPDQIKNNPEAPYINHVLLPKASHANYYFNPPHNHPSLPNYLWLEAGTNFGIHADGSVYTYNQKTNQHLVALLNNAKISWTSYGEGVTPGVCDFYRWHDPMTFFNDINDNLNLHSPQCAAHMRNTVQLTADLKNDTVARYNFIVPTNCNQMHTACGQNQIKQGDNWLAGMVPQILNSNAYKSGGVLFILWDEANHGDGPIPAIILSPFAKGNGYSNSLYYDHGSTLRTLQEIFGVYPFLGDAAKQRDLSDMFTVFP